MASSAGQHNRHPISLLHAKQQNVNKERWLRRLTARLQLGLFLKSFVDWAVVFCLVFGVLVLVSKMFWPQFWPHILWIAAAAIPVAIITFFLSRRHAFTRDQSVAILDKRIGAGGLLMTIMESPDDRWESQLPDADSIWKQAIPGLRPFRTAKHLAIPILFLLITCFIPPRTIQSLMVAPSSVSTNQVSQLTEMLNELDENEVLNDEEQDELEKEIQKLAKETKFAPLTHENWETVDALKNKMELKIRNRENELNKAASAAAALRRSLENAANAPAKEKQQLEDLLEKLAGAAGAGNNQNQLDQFGQNSLDGLSKFMQNGNFQLPENSDELRKALAELEEFIEGQCQSIGNCKNGSCFGNRFCTDGQCLGEIPGSGGINRGRGDAELTWGEESDDQGVLFRDIAIPQGIPDREGELLETRLTEPEADPQAPNARAAAREVTDALGQESWKRQLRPRHRDVIKKYFDSKSGQ